MLWVCVHCYNYTLKSRDNETCSPHLNPQSYRDQKPWLNPLTVSLKCSSVLPWFWPVLQSSFIAPLGQRPCAWGWSWPFGSFSSWLCSLAVTSDPLFPCLPHPKRNNYADCITSSSEMWLGSICPSLCVFVQWLCLQCCNYWALFMSRSFLSDTITHTIHVWAARQL